MQKLFENWRKYITEVDTDNDGIDDEKELAIIDKGEIEPEEDEVSDTKYKDPLSENAKFWIHDYLKEWLTDAWFVYREGLKVNPPSETAVKHLARDLRSGSRRETKPTCQRGVCADFNHMMKYHIDPEEQEAVSDFLGMLADKVEQESFSLDREIAVNELDSMFYVWWLQHQAASDTT